MKVEEKYNVNIEESRFTDDASYLEFNEKEEYMEFIDFLSSNDIWFEFQGSWSILMLNEDLLNVEEDL